MLRSYHVDKAIISAKGIDMNAGLTDSDDLHANNKRTMLTRAKEKILAVDSSKFDQVAFDGDRFIRSDHNYSYGCKAGNKMASAF